MRVEWLQLNRYRTLFVLCFCSLSLTTFVPLLTAMESYDDFFDDLLRTYEGNTLYLPDPEDFGLFVDDPFGADTNPATAPSPINSTSPTIPTAGDVLDLVHDYVCDACGKSSQSTEMDISERIQSIEEK